MKCNLAKLFRSPILGRHIIHKISKLSIRKYEIWKPKVDFHFISYYFIFSLMNVMPSHFYFLKHKTLFSEEWSSMYSKFMSVGDFGDATFEKNQTMGGRKIGDVL